MASGLNLARLRHILAVFAKYGFDDVFSSVGIGRWRPRRRPGAADASGRRAENLRLALEELGPTFIKFGQFLSSRPDVFPVEYITELEKLQDRVEPIQASEALDIVANQLGRPLDEIFAAVSPQPKASASLSQIHTAWLNDGAEVVLKIQRPDLERLVEVDVGLMRYLAEIIDRRSAWAKVYSFVDFVNEFHRMIRVELDFRKEGQNIERLAKNLKYFNHIHLPKVYWSHTTNRILTLERIHGGRLEAGARLAASVSRAHLAEEILEAYLKQIVQDGFFHADPHLGNLLFEPDGRVAIIDLGEVGLLDSDMKFQVAQMLLGFANQDADKITDVLLNIGAAMDGLNVKALGQDIRAMTTKYNFVSASDLSIGLAVIDLAKISVRHKLRVPQSFNLLGKTLFYVDVIIKKLCPEMDYMEFVRRSTQRILVNLWQDQFSLSRLTETALAANRLMLDGPGRLNLLLDKLVRDEIAIKFEHEHLDGLIRTLNQGANRLSYAVVVGAIIVGSALIMRLQVGGEFLGYPILGMFGFLLAALLGIYLLIRILRTERI